jgi:putative transposase
MRYTFIEAHRDQWKVSMMCRLLQVSCSGYYAWRTRPVSQREMANQALLAAIEEAFAASDGTYGSPRIYEEVKNQVDCSIHRVARLMRQHGIRAKQPRRYKVTTKQKDGRPAAPNHLQQTFTATRPAEKWCGDITYVWTAAGWLYLAVIIDLFSRRIVGWAMDRRMTATLVSDAFRMAWRQTRPETELLFHSDRGSQYTSQPYQQLLAAHNVQVSMSGTGNCYDNAVVESFFGSLKMERVHYARYQTREEAKTDIFFYIESFYNRRRRHSSLGYLSPLAYEASCHEQAAAMDHCMSPLN